MADKKKVLHVEDDTRWTDIVRRNLEEAGYEVSSFDTLPAAKQAADSEPFDYFICDGRVGPVDATEWAIELFEEGRKVVSLSGMAFTPKGMANMSKGQYDGDKLVAMLNSL
ncbi:MAG TPA: hypothetical protein VI874_04040 [Candidatus Norongarragalinales archaeon]|nr:hypothetical protein [Candidatus Norongarragalinales archaeon]